MFNYYEKTSMPPLELPSGLSIDPYYSWQLSGQHPAPVLFAQQPYRRPDQQPGFQNEANLPPRASLALPKKWTSACAKMLSGWIVNQFTPHLAELRQYLLASHWGQHVGRRVQSTKRKSVPSTMARQVKKLAKRMAEVKALRDRVRTAEKILSLKQ